MDKVGTHSVPGDKGFDHTGGLTTPNAHQIIASVLLVPRLVATVRNQFASRRN